MTRRQKIEAWLRESPNVENMKLIVAIIGMFSLLGVYLLLSTAILSIGTTPPVVWAERSAHYWAKERFLDAAVLCEKIEGFSRHRCVVMPWREDLVYTLSCTDKDCQQIRLETNRDYYIRNNP